MSVTTCAFDAYGTLFDVASAARAVAAEPGREAFARAWPRVAERWRAKQLQYTWLRAVMNRHADFEQVTRDALEWVLDAEGFDEPALHARLMRLYFELEAYAEAPATLQAVRDAGLNTAILSNGSPAMLDAAIASAGIGHLLDDVLSVERVGVFKPARAVYDLVGARFHCAPQHVLFVSANGWDAAAAAAYGFETVWVNRDGDPCDRLPARPHHIVTDLRDIPALAMR